MFDATVVTIPKGLRHKVLAVYTPSPTPRQVNSTITPAPMLEPFKILMVWWRFLVHAKAPPSLPSFERSNLHQQE